jgi:hypothetical protein
VTARGIPGGTGRRANNAGGIATRQLASGELRFHARLHGRHVGTFATRVEAEAALDAALIAAREIAIEARFGRERSP